jgi:phosphoadenosine phosphosulfate reductase
MQQYLNNYEPTEADMVAAALALPLAIKIQKAVATLKEWEAKALALSPDGYWLAYSGGKDSDVILELAKMAGVKFRAVYNVTTIDPPELVRYIREVHTEVEFNRPAVAMLKRLVESSNGPPTRLARWCCEEYKERGGNDMAKIVGVRIAESARRAKLWRTIVPSRDKVGLFVCPIAYWTDDDVWAFHAIRGIPHCSLYDEGFKRLGCIGCPLAGSHIQAQGLKRWPKYAALWRKAFDGFWEKWHDVPVSRGPRKGLPRFFVDFGSAQGLWDWWVSGKAADNAEDCQGYFLFAKTEDADMDNEGAAQ